MILPELSLKSLRKVVALLLFMERHQRSVRTKLISLQSGINENTIQRVELGKGCHLSHYQHLLAFYGKKVKIELVDKDD